ncbi:hypothetical protein [Streptomyces albipurpureus]|uniref:Uncharacterized protein n=1 Tax=Streptomyces albipurpureus TaxID=2897419 RepID=A0ABT0UPL4_9ACTN|nr:hypothetical protein [Streptomyces sp. CWNU-1]MCM2390483.1 hypothetical protein [Streptomyces sp. CWNU-1]
MTAWLRAQGRSDIAEGTVCALLVGMEQRGLGRHEEEFCGIWSFLAERLD